jgi:hypothetical protein
LNKSRNAPKGSTRPILSSGTHVGSIDEKTTSDQRGENNETHKGARTTVYAKKMTARKCPILPPANTIAPIVRKELKSAFRINVQSDSTSDELIRNIKIA